MPGRGKPGPRSSPRRGKKSTGMACSLRLSKLRSTSASRLRDSATYTLAPSRTRISARMRMFQPTNRQRMRAKSLCTNVSVLDGVAHPADSSDQWPGEAAVDLIAQIVNVDLDHVRRGLAVVAPDVLGDLVLAEHPPGVAHQVGEQVELFGGQLDRLAAAGRLVAGQVEHQVADGGVVLLAVAGAAA